MDEARLDGLLISGAVDDVHGLHSANRFYASGFSGSTGRVLITARKAFIAVDSRYVEQAEQECVPRGFELFTFKEKAEVWMRALLSAADLGGERLGVEGDDMTVAEYEHWRNAAANLRPRERPELVPARRLIERLRARKDAEELAAIQRAIDIADRAFEDVAASLVPGQTETAIARAIEERIRAHGGQGVSFDTIVAAGPHGALPHASPRDVAVRAGDGIVIDMGARAGGYCSDLTRTIVAGEPDDRFRAIYEIVFAAQQHAIERVEPGMPGSVAHDLAWSVIDRAGYGEQFGHGLGHGVGLAVHEQPYLGKTSEDTLEEGMVFTIEPGIYLRGWGGIRIEDVVVLEEGRARVLSHATKLTPAGVH